MKEKKLGTSSYSSALFCVSLAASLAAFAAAVAFLYHTSHSQLITLKVHTFQW